MNVEKTTREICPAGLPPRAPADHSSRSPIWSSVTWPCASPAQADAILGGLESGYAYQRDGHPNADILAEKCRLLHGADHAVVTSSGMSAMALAMLTLLRPGDHVLLSSRLYGKTVSLFTGQGAAWGIVAETVDMSDLEQVAGRIRNNTRMLVCETISNPTLRVIDLAALASVTHSGGARLLVDNTFASPIVCRPLEWGADLVVESMTKIMNGHCDVVMGLLCGRGVAWQAVSAGLACWGMTTSPFACWLCERGLITLHVRAVAACATALEVARRLVGLPHVRHVDYPGLADHPDHAIAVRQFGTAEGARFGHVVTLHLDGDETTVAALMREMHEIEYCTSLGEPVTSISHPASSSHRSLTPGERQSVGVGGGTIRMSVGLESADFIVKTVQNALQRLD